MNTERYHLAQVNIATLRAPLDAPEMADFVAQIRSINAIADADPGFVWRLRSEGADDATSIRAFEDERILLTLTVWESLEALSNYVYRSAHAGVMRDCTERTAPWAIAAVGLKKPINLSWRCSGF